MSAEYAIETASSRPKIHRLPGQERKNLKKFRFIKILNSTIMLACLMMFAIASVGALSGNAGMSPEAAKPQQLASLDSPQPAPPLARSGNGDRSVTFSGQNDKIVGFMARIPPQDEASAEIKPISEVDNKAGRDLLSILSKY